MSRLALAAYAVVLVGIIVVANLGGTMEVFGLLADVPFGDKIGHFVLMGGLAWLADRAARRRDMGRLPLGPSVVLALVTLEELSQIWLPTRSFDLADLAADVAGVAAFTALSRWTARAPVARHP